MILQTQRRYKACIDQKKNADTNKKPVRSKGEIRHRKTNKSKQARRDRGKNRAMTTSTGIEKKKELLSSEERRGDARKEHDAGKILQDQATAETFPRKPSTNHRKKGDANQKKTPTHHTANELGSGGVKSSHLEGRKRGNEDDDIEPCAIGSRAPPAYQKTHQKRQSKGETR